MTDFGTDINTPDVMDLDPNFADIAGAECLGQALARRLVTPRGALLDDPGYGHDVRQALNDDNPDTGAEVIAIVEQLEADERVETATAEVTFTELTGQLRIVATAYTAQGPFRLTLDVSAVTVTLLTVEAL